MCKKSYIIVACAYLAQNCKTIRHFIVINEFTLELLISI